MSAVPIPIRATGPHPAAAVLAQRADAAVTKRTKKPDSAATGYRRARAPEWVLQVFAMLAGIAVFIVLWEVVARQGGRIPGPVVVWKAAVTIFSDPFYSKGPNDQGIGWNVLSSLKRVGIGFGLAAAVGIPLGFMIGRFKFLSDMAAPIIAMLKPVSPLAWLPIGLLLFKAANPAAIYVIFVCSLWPMIVNTAVGVRQIPQDYLNVARVLRLSRWTMLWKILLPATLPYMFTGFRLSLGIAWLVIVAAEMLTGVPGVGGFLWQEYNSLIFEHIILCIITIGVVGFLLDRLMSLVEQRIKFA